MSKWHSKDAAYAINELASSPSTGLSDEEAGSRLGRFGPNALAEARKKTLFARFFDQFRGFLVILLLISAFVSAAFREFGDAAAIMVIVLINAVLSVIQENKAENALEALKRMTNPKARCIRGGRIQVVDASGLVPGDIVLLEAGDVVPADLRLIEDAALRIEEAAITGESLPAEKSSSILLEEGAQLGDRVNMAFMGTSITYGRGRGIVTATGMATEVGRIAGMLEQQDESMTPLQVTLDKLGKALGAIAVLLSAVVFIAGLARGEEPLVMFMTAVSLAVAAIPEGLTAIVTIVLALGVQRMAKRNAIIRRLPAVETLGSANVVCSDKTGTLTTNKMTVKKLFVAKRWIEVTGSGHSPEGHFTSSGTPYDYGSDAALMQLIYCSVLCNDASFEPQSDGSHAMIGDPTEACLLVSAAKAGIWKSSLEKAMPRALEVPFDSARKRMSTIHPQGFGGFRLYVKGAPDELIMLSSHRLAEGTAEELSQKAEEELHEANEAMAESGMRVLAMAFKDLPALPDKADSSIEAGLTFIGLAGMQDPARPETAPAVHACHEAGIIPVMITGDHKSTAWAIARQVGIADQDSMSLSGRELDEMGDAELLGAVEGIRVYARVSPEHKMRIINAWKSKGYIVAMTGDGVNDAPALKRADIGVAMGITGTDVSKGASDMILTDDNFATIVQAIEEGRTIFSNIRKSVQYLIRCNIGEIVLVFSSIAAGFARPLLPIQILWVNLVTDSLPALALGVDPADKDVMIRRPRGKSDPVLSGRMLAMLALHGVILGFSAIASFLVGERAAFWGLAPGLEAARTMCLITITFGQLFTSFSVSSSRSSVFKDGLNRNPYLLKAVVISGMLQIGAIYVPGIREFLKAVPLTWQQLAVALGFAALMLPAAELLKALFRKEDGFRKKESQGFALKE